MNFSMQLRRTCLTVLYSSLKTRRQRISLKSHLKNYTHSVHAFLLERLFYQRNKIRA